MATLFDCGAKKPLKKAHSFMEKDSVQADIYLVSQHPLVYQNQFAGWLSIGQGFTRLSRVYPSPVDLSASGGFNVVKDVHRVLLNTWHGLFQYYSHVGKDRIEGLHGGFLVGRSCGGVERLTPYPLEL
jgi:hypothetical protein